MRNVHGCMLSATREKVVSNETPTAQYNFVYIRYLELYEFDLARIRRQKATVLFHLPTVTMKSVISFILMFVFSSMSKSKFYLPVALKKIWTLHFTYIDCVVSKYIPSFQSVFVSLACLLAIPSNLAICRVPIYSFIRTDLRIIWFLRSILAFFFWFSSNTLTTATWRIGGFCGLRSTKKIDIFGVTLHWQLNMSIAFAILSTLNIFISIILLGVCVSSSALPLCECCARS